jgi:glycosyltransferase involved in cell wall biosynthesis
MLSFIVIAHHNHATLNECLDSIEKNSHLSDELILVLNNPDRQTSQIAFSRPKWHIVHESKPGPQHARNSGAAYAHGDIFAFIDADIYIPNDWRAMMLAQFANPWIAAGMSGIHTRKTKGLLNKFKRLTNLSFLYQFYHMYPGLYVLDTANMMVRRSWFQKVGGFNPDYSRVEDTDFSLRLLWEGADLFYENRVWVEEIYDPYESLLSFLLKSVETLKFKLKFNHEHGFDFQFPFSYHLPVYRPHRLKTPWLITLFKIYGIATVDKKFLAPARHKPKVAPHKKSYLTNFSPDIRSVWKGDKEIYLNLITRQRLRAKQE